MCVAGAWGRREFGILLATGRDALNDEMWSVVGRERQAGGAGPDLLVGAWCGAPGRRRRKNWRVPFSLPRSSLEGERLRRGSRATACRARVRNCCAGRLSDVVVD